MMTTIKQMLVATDLSSRADRALARAVQLARAHATALTVMHVIEPVRRVPADLGTWPPQAQPAELEAKAANGARQELQSWLIALDHPDAGIVTRCGLLFIEIIHEARENNADLVVLGAHGRSFL